MKISFNPQDRPQQPEQPEQARMRGYRSRRLPVARVVLVAALALVVVLALWFVYRRGTIYTHGLVAGKVDEVRAPERSRLVSVHAQQGDIVRKGDLLVILESDEGKQRLVLAGEKLKKARIELDAFEGEGAADSAADRLARLDASRKAVEALERELLNVGETAGRLSNRRKAQIAKADSEVKKLTEFHQQKKVRFENVQKLLDMDAAVKADLESARTQERLAFWNLDQARHDLDHLREMNRLDGDSRARQLAMVQSSLDRAREHYKELSSAYDDLNRKEELYRRHMKAILEANLAQAEAEDAAARRAAGPTEYRALFDGLVTELPKSEGGTVEKGDLVCALAATGEVWVDAYVPPDKVTLLWAGRDVRIHCEQQDGVIQGRIAVERGIEVKVPAVLSDRMPARTTAIRLRVDAEAGAQILPGTVVRLVVK